MPPESHIELTMERIMTVSQENLTAVDMEERREKLWKITNDIFMHREVPMVQTEYRMSDRLHAVTMLEYGWQKNDFMLMLKRHPEILEWAECLTDRELAYILYRSRN